MDRKKQVQLIESYLKNYKTYQVGMKNIQESLDDLMQNYAHENTVEIKPIDAIDHNLEAKIFHLRQQLYVYRTIINSIDLSLNALTDDEEKYIRLRYFEGRSIEKTALQLGYSMQNCFKIRNQIMNKLLISLKNLIKLPFVE